MLHPETVEKGTLDLIKKLMADEKLSSFNLVGGTALAFKIGHRKSIDIDLFSFEDFNSQELANHLSANYNVSRVQSIHNGLFCVIDGIKVDLLTHKYSLIEELEITEEIRIASLKDIGAMKLNAIFNNGTRLKDFIDIYCLLEKFSLQQLLQTCLKKYTDINILMVKQSLIHYEDIDFTVSIDYIDEEIKWAEVSQRLTNAVHNPNQIFNKLPLG